MARYVYPFEPKPYYARRRPYEVDGEIISTLTTRYSYERAMRPCEGPRGGKAYRPFYRNVYYYDGRFYKACNRTHDDGTYYNSLEPITGNISEIPASNRNSKKNAPVPVASIACDGGVPISIVLDGEEMALRPSDWTFCAQLLGLEEPTTQTTAA